MITRTEWDALEAAGICPECRQSQSKHVSTCRKKWFDYGYRVGYHDGANSLDRWDGAFLVEQIEADEVDNDK